MMERLTLPHYGGNGHYMKCSERFGCDGNCGECDDLDKIVDRLAHYEDTGLEPDKIKEADDFLKENYSVPLARLVEAYELLKAKDEGRLLILPCKVGDTVYILDGDYYDEELYVEEHKVVGLTLSYEHEWYFFVNKCLGQRLEPFEVCDIGKTVFLTREEAEQALKGGAN